MRPKLRKISDKPGVYIIDNFLSPRECATLIQMGQAALGKTVDVSKAKTLVSSDGKVLDYKTFGQRRTHWFEQSENKTVRAIGERIEKMVFIPLENQAKTQVCHYDKGGFLFPRRDTFDKTYLSGTPLITFLVYLNDIEEGGETFFPNLGIKVVPAKGRALFWFNFDRADLSNVPEILSRQGKGLKLSEDSLHTACPIIKGEKWIMVKFLHYRPWVFNPLTVNPPLLKSRPRA